ncbi:hypothetical protein AB0907_24075 [Streptomyces sp. NPDC006975]|uniref:hypothetical protein n=1 Tax=unclassified Streptomyces TaxID=2593676 RepID=UPI003452B7EE
MQIRTALAACVVLAAALTGCGSSDTGAGSGSATAEGAAPRPKPKQADKYEQTWTVPYSNTTCGDYLNNMDDHQRWVAAADMLVGARKTDGGSGLPADSEVTRFQEDISTACRASADLKTTEVAVSVYLVDSSYKP